MPSAPISRELDLNPRGTLHSQRVVRPSGPGVRNATWATLVCVAALSSCATREDSICHGGMTPMRGEVVYFGANKPGGKVTDEEWRRFLADSVTPRFPDGLTVWQASGQWRGASGVVELEHSRVLSLIHAGSPKDEQNLGEVISAYKARFQQEAVLRVTHRVCTSL